MRVISQRARDALNASHKRVTVATLTVPYGDPVPITFKPGGTVTASKARGSRYQANVTLAPQPGSNLFELVKTPGAYFDILHGINYGHGDLELWPLLHGQVSASTTVDVFGGEIPLTLCDDWQRIERSDFLVPTGFNSGYRPVLIENIAVGAVPDMPGVQNRSAAGNGPLVVGSTGMWDRKRTEAIDQLATDGTYDVAFDAAGLLIIQDEQILNPTQPVWTYRSGVVGNIVTAARTRPLDRLYNTVVVVPSDESQTWSRVQAQVEDINHPRHPDRPGVGVNTFFWSSPTITSDAAARAAAATILQRVLGTTETIALTALGNPAQEIGDTVTVVHEPTSTDPGFAEAHIVDGITWHLDTGDMELATRSNSVADLEES